jgi:3alpha(or 20beta)-hydroxysteroid dehydrogenase
MQRLAGKVAVVTGAARGQGEEIARLFVKEGAAVLVTDVLDDLGEAVAESLGEKAHYCHLDVTNEDDWRNAISVCESTFSHATVLINNAGIGVAPHGTMKTTVEEHRRVMAINEEGVWLGMRAVAKGMVAAGGGSIVNTSSIDGLHGVAGMTSYVASKFAVTGMTRAVAAEWGPSGIRVNSVHPGMIFTPMMENAPAIVVERIEAIVAAQPIPRMGTPRDIAYLMVYLASDESSFVTGAQFVIDGGHLAAPFRDLSTLGDLGL